MSTEATELPPTSTTMTTKTIDLPRDTKEPEKCFLLDLPGGKYRCISVVHIILRRLAELRNRIYYFATVEGCIWYHPRHLRKETNSSKMLNDHLDEGNREQRTTKSFSLTQVCRQTRAEYSPIYAAATKIYVGHHDLTYFMDDECPRMARDKNGEVVGSLVVDYRSDHIDPKTGKYEPGYALEIDLLPFLKFCMNKHGLDVKLNPYNFCCEECIELRDSLSEVMEVLFALASNPKLKNWLSDKAENVTLSRFALIQIWLKEGKETEWMKEWNRDIKTSELREWMHDVGFAEPEWEGILFKSKHSDIDDEFWTDCSC
jgi:hypothetical protein